MQLTVLYNGRKQSAFLLDEPHVVIGRGRSAHVALDGNPIVSRQHAVVREVEGGHVLEDMGGANGTFVNDTAVKEATLKPGDRIVLGKHTLRYEAATEEAQSVKPQRSPRVAATGLGLPDESSTMRVEPVQGPAPGSPNLAAPPPKAPPKRGPGDGFQAQERTVAASKEELESLLAQMKVKSQPHLSTQTATGLELIPLTDPPVLIGHTDACRIRLDGSPWFGRVAARIEPEGGKWVIHAASTFWNPVQVGGSKLLKKRSLQEGSIVAVRDRKFRFSEGEKG
jgi:pSer/pThr/pTyr-binding forkhead associated (FHA) protein